MHPVAFGEAVGEPPRSLDPALAKEGHQQCGGRDAVDVVVTVDGYPLSVGDGPEEPLDGPVHIPHGERVVEGLQGSLQHGLGVLGRAHLPGDEAVGHQGVDCAGLRERLDLLGRGGPKPPALQHCHRGFGSLVLELTRASTIASWVFCISGSPQASLLMMMEKASSSASALTP